MPENSFSIENQEKFDLAYNFLYQYWYVEKISFGLDTINSIKGEAQTLARVKFHKKDKLNGMESAKGKLREAFALNWLRILVGDDYDFGFSSQYDDQNYGIDIVVRTKDGKPIGAIDVKDESYHRAIAANLLNAQEKAERRAERQSYYEVPVVTFALDYDLMGLGGLYPLLSQGDDLLLGTPYDITYSLFNKRVLTTASGESSIKIINAFNDAKKQIATLSGTQNDTAMAEFLTRLTQRLPEFEVPFGQI